MPHKRAKRSVREQQRKERGTDFAPSGGGNNSLSTEGIPKSISRVLDAAKIRAEYRHKRARLEEVVNKGDSPPLTKKRRTSAALGAVAKKGKHNMIEIQPGESLKHFNRRVEDHMRPLVQSAMRNSATTERRERKVIATATVVNEPQRAASGSGSRKMEKDSSRNSKSDVGDSHIAAIDKHHDRPKEFATVSSSTPRRLNDIVVAPPELKKLPRGAAKSAGKYTSQTKAGGVLSMAQRAMMSVERENVIRRYREMKERKAKESERTLAYDDNIIDDR
ncbi:hypothetical protein B0F90DRAFT_1626588 [Multifurca ochricompacta]|uniref:Uncharacterized protein n=1 Tax=Multifurca ochricompacta TaxID=376703 RepID=A0AAD4M6M1_9AGAM|nr:hypothetical protein B0F90DRAFT_1626588 [Multifurca ochricompacta]